MANGGLQDLNDSHMDLIPLRAAESITASLRVNTREVQDLGSIDVPNAGHDRLIEKSHFDLATAAGKSSSQFFRSDL